MIGEEGIEIKCAIETFFLLYCGGDIGKEKESLLHFLKKQYLTTHYVEQRFIVASN